MESGTSAVETAAPTASPEPAEAGESPYQRARILFSTLRWIVRPKTRNGSSPAADEPRPAPPPPEFRARFGLGLSRVRRWLTILRGRDVVAARHAQRHGACTRCGACCQITIRCPHLYYDAQGLAGCRIYPKRVGNCRFYPLDPLDLADRDWVFPGRPCGFHFNGNGKGRPAQ